MMIDHYGTYVDAPSHIHPDGIAVDKIPVGYLPRGPVPRLEPPLRGPDLRDRHQSVQTVTLSYNFLGYTRFGAVEWRSDQ